MMESKNPEIPIEISPSQLSNEALYGIISNFILREGTDYGWIELSFEKKVEQIQKQLNQGKIKIVFDQASETVSLMNACDFARQIKRGL
jgi:uncharacterized protein YheU (UPF0270 family)